MPRDDFPPILNLGSQHPVSPSVPHVSVYWEGASIPFTMATWLLHSRRETCSVSIIFSSFLLESHRISRWAPWPHPRIAMKWSGWLLPPTPHSASRMSKSPVPVNPTLLIQFEPCDTSTPPLLAYFS